jgi:hypothetical protein
MNFVTHAPAVRVNGVDPRHVDRLARLEAALEKATSEARRQALLADIQTLKEG